MQMGATKNYNYIIVGAGSAGCLLAERLSANPATRVCLIEAGPPDSSPFIRMPTGVALLMNSPRYNWRYWSKPQTHLDNRRLYIPRGRTLGGSSAINAQIYIRGHAADYNHWSELGNSGWSYDEVLPYFKRTEHQHRKDLNPDYHGFDGPLHVSDLEFKHSPSEAFIAAGQAAGYPHCEDFNGGSFEGIGYYQVTQNKGKRCSLAEACLRPASSRDNLHILTNTHTQRVLVDGGRAYGVEVRNKEGVSRITAEGEVLLCAGAINSPQLLMLSGIGDPEDLSPHAIRVEHALPGVGKNLQDHLDILVVCRSKNRDTFSYSPTYWPRATRALWQYFRGQRGAMSTNITESGGFIRSSDEVDYADVQLHLTVAMLDNHGLNKAFNLGYGFSLHACNLRPKSRGRISLDNPDPACAPIIDFNFLDHEDDLQTLIRGLKASRRILNAAPIADQIRSERLPGAAVATDREIERYIRAKAETIYHPVGTCKMGVDDMAVVGPDLKVHGVEGLRVVDASIMPTLVSGNTNAPTVMIAERAADLILGNTMAAPR